MERKEGPRRPLTLTSRERGKGKEPQELPNVWDVLEHRVKAWTPDPNRSYSARIDEQNKVDLLIDGLKEKGTDRDRLIVDLFYHTQPVLSPSKEQFQQFRSNVEPLSEEEIAKELQKHMEAMQERTPQSPVFYSGVGLFDVYKRKDKKS